MQEIVRNYLALPDTGNTGKGMVAGGSLSPLLAALYLLPLDTAMDEMQNKDGILYRRFMDDFVILAPTSWKLRKAIQRVHAVLKTLGLTLYKEKRFIGKSAKGSDFSWLPNSSRSQTASIWRMYSVHEGTCPPAL